MSVAAFHFGPSKKQRLCLVVGLGLIGQQIAKHLALYTKQIKLDPKKLFDWNKPKEISDTLTSIINTHKAKQVEVIWSAGKAGFAATDADMEKEFATYTEVMHSLKTIKLDELCINLLSSAGGIYENSGIVDNLEDISPSRPYANWKLKQEQFLHKHNFKCRIYRISSVYGIGNETTRIGLINHLVKNAKVSKGTLIYAQQNTLRDYISNYDVARYVTQNVLNNTNNCIELIASGRAVSINMLINMVSQITRRPVKATYLTGYENDNDIIFSNKLLPKNLKHTSLEEGIRVINAFA